MFWYLQPDFGLHEGGRQFRKHTTDVREIHIPLEIYPKCKQVRLTARGDMRQLVDFSATSRPRARMHGESTSHEASAGRPRPSQCAAVLRPSHGAQYADQTRLN
eukprot:jgi/Ulvmu1/7271/UM035_0059.1